MCNFVVAYCECPGFHCTEQIILFYSSNSFRLHFQIACTDCSAVHSKHQHKLNVSAINEIDDDCM